MSEIVRLNDGSFVMLNTERCEWLLGFNKGDRVWINLKGETPALVGKILDVFFDIDTKEYVIKLSFFDTASTVFVRARDVEQMGADSVL